VSSGPWIPGYVSLEVPHGALGGYVTGWREGERGGTWHLAAPEALAPPSPQAPDSTPHPSPRSAAPEPAGRPEWILVRVVEPAPDPGPAAPAARLAYRMWATGQPMQVGTCTRRGAGRGRGAGPRVAARRVSVRGASRSSPDRREAESPCESGSLSPLHTRSVAHSQRRRSRVCDSVGCAAARLRLCW
jgi:hypothetical protein